MYKSPKDGIIGLMIMKVLVSAGFAAALVAGCGEGSSGPKTFDVSGTIDVPSVGAHNIGEACDGTEVTDNEYRTGTPVLVLNGKTSKTAFGKITAGKQVNWRTCRLNFTVTDVPKLKTVYAISINHVIAREFKNTDSPHFALKVS